MAQPGQPPGHALGIGLAARFSLRPHTLNVNQIFPDRL